MIQRKAVNIHNSHNAENVIIMTPGISRIYPDKDHYGYLDRIKDCS